MIESVLLAAQIAMAKRGGHAMPKYPGLTDRGKGMTDLLMWVVVSLALSAAAAWFLTPGK